MIKISKPYIENKNNRSRCICDIYFNNEKKQIWFEVDSKYEKYLCTERADAYLIGLLNFAMRNNEDIYCDVPITEELLYNIKKILMPSLVNHSKSLYMINIIARTAPALKDGFAIGTGCSCGIDSFSAIYNHLNTEFNGMDITHLCLNNVGAYNDCYSSYGKEKVKDERFELTKKAADDIGLELIETDSNFADVVFQEHILTHTYSSVFAIYMLQKLWKKYYYASSGLDYSYFSLEDNDIHECSHYELLSLQCFSTETLRIYSEGGEKTRFEKTKDIVDYLPAQMHLHVCLSKPYNCGVCSKCKRTLLTLDLLDKLDNFNNVFDIEYYKNNKKMYYKWLYAQHLNKDLLNEVVYQMFKNKLEFKNAILLYRFFKPFSNFIKKIIPNGIKKNVKKIFNK